MCVLGPSHRHTDKARGRASDSLTPPRPIRRIAPNDPAISSRRGECGAHRCPGWFHGRISGVRRRYFSIKRRKPECCPSSALKTRCPALWRASASPFPGASDSPRLVPRPTVARCSHTPRPDLDPPQGCSRLGGDLLRFIGLLPYLVSFPGVCLGVFQGNTLTLAEEFFRFCQRGFGHFVHGLGRFMRFEVF